jgi:hypothetical protein
MSWAAPLPRVLCSPQRSSTTRGRTSGARRLRRRPHGHVWGRRQSTAYSTPSEGGSRTTSPRWSGTHHSADVPASGRYGPTGRRSGVAPMLLSPVRPRAHGGGMWAFLAAGETATRPGESVRCAAGSRAPRHRLSHRAFADGPNKHHQLASHASAPPLPPTTSFRPPLRPLTAGQVAPPGLGATHPRFRLPSTRPLQLSAPARCSTN